jgi:hypothetical protein
MATNPQDSLFSFDDLAESNIVVSTALQLSSRSAQPLSKWQQAFNTLTSELSTLREALLHAQELLDAHRADLVKFYEPRWRDMQSARRDWVHAADRVLQRQASLPKTQRLTRKRQKHLTAFLVELVGSLLMQADETGEDDDPNLVAVHDRYNDFSLSEVRAQHQDLMQAVLEKVVGKEAMQRHDADDIEGLPRHATRASHASLKREQAAKAISQSVREVYRRLASSLHPDREPDLTERARKTEWMQQANLAYEHGDLMQLLSLQMQLLQGDAKALARADDARLKLYCQALREQRDVLRAEVAASEAPLRDALRMGPRGPAPTREALLASVQADAKQLKQAAGSLRTAMMHVQNPHTCAAVVDSLVLADEDPDEAVAFEGFDTLVTRSSRRRRR